MSDFAVLRADKKKLFAGFEQMFLVEENGLVTLSLSGGKNSTALLYLLYERGKLPDFIVFCDTGKEFPEILAVIDELNFLLPITIWRMAFTEEQYNEWRYGLVSRGKHRGKHRGKPLKYFPCWLHREAKAKPLSLFPGKKIVGYTAEEKRRKLKGSLAPLRLEGKDDDWCLLYLFSRGLLRNIHWEYPRTGCFDCPKQPESNYERMKIFHPDYFLEAVKE